MHFELMNFQESHGVYNSPDDFGLK
uniref:Uncharacterized protein n=1 Tax=Anguilla anguilla TaxID=7936 RepID=A0A0E9TXY0_ANGAN